MTSVSTRFFAHPSETTPTEGRGFVMGAGIRFFEDTRAFLSRSAEMPAS
jgi:hypothetical protein